jgi:hypothetical protein
LSDPSLLKRSPSRGPGIREYGSQIRLSSHSGRLIPRRIFYRRILDRYAGPVVPNDVYASDTSSFQIIQGPK